MKKHLMSALAIVLMALAAGCAQNDTNLDNPGGKNVNQITFRATTAKTRANDNGADNLKSGFNVIAINKDGGYIPGFADPNGENVQYYYNTIVTPQAWDWKDAALKDAKRWPIDASLYPLTFYAAFPKVDYINAANPKVDVEATANITSNPTFIYNTQYSGTLNTITPATVTTDYLAALATVNTAPVTGFADLTFKHIMSNIVFEIVLPNNYEATIQSIKIANVNFKGRKYDYQAGKWGGESVYSDTHHAHYAYYAADGTNAVQTITASNTLVKGFPDGALGNNTLKLMPQTKVTRWALGLDDTTPDSFKKDAAAWKAAHQFTTEEEKKAAINDWHNRPVGGTTSGMQNSNGWRGARIELTYILVDRNNTPAKNLVGYKKDVDAANADLFVRVGYTLDLNELVTKTGITEKGLLAGYKYKFSIPLGTPGATNGVLLDPDFKDDNGNNTDKPVDKPENLSPGVPITPAGVINFNVTVDNWEDSNKPVN